MCVGKRESQIRYLFFLTRHKSLQPGKTTFFHPLVLGTSEKGSPSNGTITSLLS